MSKQQDNFAMDFKNDYTPLKYRNQTKQLTTP